MNNSDVSLRSAAEYINKILTECLSHIATNLPHNDTARERGGEKREPAERSRKSDLSPPIRSESDSLAATTVNRSTRTVYV